MRPALVATSHGTDDPDGRRAVAGLVDAVRRRLPDVAVHDAFVDVQEPSPDDVVAGVPGAAVVVPLLIAPGFHVRVDVERAAAGEDRVAAATLGPDQRLVSVLVRRLLEVGADDADALVVASAGSTDPVALECFDRIARDLGAAVGHIVPVGHVGGAGRPLAEVVDAARTGGRRVVVASMLMAPGFFHRRVLASDADLVTAPLLDLGTPDPRMIDLVVDRYRAAESSFTGAKPATGLRETLGA